MQRLGLFGGSFNPVHLGHLLVAQAAREELQLGRMFFIPAAQSPFKPGRVLAPGQERLRWLRLALAGQPDCEVDGQELERGGISYTIDTVRNYSRWYPAAELVCLIGADHAALLPKWRDAEALVRMASFAIVPRPGQVPVATPAPFRVCWLKGYPLEVSSSQIRERIRAGLPIDFLVPPGVGEAIRNNRLYL